jgi:predicted MFS family arabinose efflux permease
MPAKLGRLVGNGHREGLGLLMMAVVGTLAFEFEVSFPLLAHTTFHGGADAYGWLLGSFGVGAVAGGVYALEKARTGIVRLGRVSLGYAAAMALLAIAPTLWTAVAAAALVGVATIFFLTTGNSTVQLASDPQYRGRVMALWSIAVVGLTPIGAPIIGAVSQALGPRAAIGLGALACIAAASIGKIGRRLQARTPTTDVPAVSIAPLAAGHLSGEVCISSQVAKTLTSATINQPSGRTIEDSA